MNNYRILEENEKIIEGDELLYIDPLTLNHKWIKADPNNHRLYGIKYRRKV